jgi:predicted peptidase
MGEASGRKLLFLTMKYRNQLVWLFTILIVPTMIMLIFALNGFLGIHPFDPGGSSMRWWIFGFVGAAAVLFFAVIVRVKETFPLEPIVFKGKDGQTLPYRLMKPAGYDPATKYPLVVFLHGAGDRGSDNEKQISDCIPQFASKENRAQYPCFLIAPQCPENAKWSDVDWAADSHTISPTMTEPARLTIELIEAIANEYSIDTKRIYITGLSMGGYGTWDLIARRPDLFAAAVPICGGADEATAAKVKHIPIWVFHGAKDDVVNAARSRNMVAALVKAGGKPKYTEYPDVGHDSWNPAYRDPELLKWLFAQGR